AAILRERLTLLPTWTTRRRVLAARYRAGLRDAPIDVPPQADEGHVYHLFPVRSAARESVRAHLRAHGIETLIHYPIPISRQRGLASDQPAVCPVADRVCDEIFSLPLHPALPEAAVDRVTDVLRHAR